MPPSDASGAPQQPNTEDDGGAPTPVETGVPDAPAPQDSSSDDLSPEPAPQAPAVPVAAKRNKGPLLAIIAVVIVLAVAGAGYYWWTAQQNTPDKVFTGALTKLLSTSAITQTETANNVSGSVEYDGGNIKNPKVSVAAVIKDSGLTYKLSGYGTLQNDYVKYTSFGNMTIDNAFDGLVNKWISLRKDGTLQQDVDSDLEGLTDPRVAMFGDVLIGNFSASQRQQLMDYITANKIYAYSANHVQTSTVHGKKVYVYAITENIPKLKELNKKVATMVGLKSADIQPALDQLGTAGTTKLYIDVKTKQIVQYSAVEDGETIGGAYTDYDTTSLPQEPKADLTWIDFEKKQADVAGNLFSNLTGGDTTTTTPEHA